MIRSTIVQIAFASALCAQDPLSLLSMGFQPQQEGREDADYQSGRKALDASQWDQAIASFDASISHKSASADGAMYWKAYAQNRAGRRTEALATIAALRKAYPSSRWLNDAQELEVEIRAKSGAPVSPAAEGDEDLKIIAINSLMQSDPEQAFPILEKLLNSNNSVKVKEKALFVLTQSGSPKAQKLLGDIARGSSNPDLQMKALKYIGMMGNESSRKELASIYQSTSDVKIKKAILESFMISGARGFLFNAAKTETNPDLRRQAIKQLALTGGQDELWQLYGSENSTDVKQEILKSMFLAGNSTRLVDIAKTEHDPKLRIAAIKSLGLMGGNGDALVAMYRADQTPEVRKEILNALFIQGNGKALVDLARSETNPEMKREIINKMALVHSKETTDYMMEILK
jgi:HEAT repeat protein